MNERVESKIILVLVNTNWKKHSNFALPFQPSGYRCDLLGQAFSSKWLRAVLREWKSLVILKLKVPSASKGRCAAAEKNTVWGFPSFSEFDFVKLAVQSWCFFLENKNDLGSWWKVVMGMDLCFLTYFPWSRWVRYFLYIEYEHFFKWKKCTKRTYYVYFGPSISLMPFTKVPGTSTDESVS